MLLLLVAEKCEENRSRGESASGFSNRERGLEKLGGRERDGLLRGRALGRSPGAVTSVKAKVCLCGEGWREEGTLFTFTFNFDVILECECVWPPGLATAVP